MNFMKNYACSLLLLMPAVGLASSALAAPPDPRVADTSQPGSVIVFPKFATGTVAVDGATTARTEIELGAVCPFGVVCPEHQSIKVRFHWVCPGDDNITNKYICTSNDFDVFLTVDGKAVFNPENLPVAGSQFHKVPKPGFNSDGTPCTRGYLIGYVVDTSDRPIKYDGLIGDAVLRISGTAVSAYRAITIQADTALANGALITLTPDPFLGATHPRLAFDGAPGHYKAITGQVSGDVKYDDVGPPTRVGTTLVLLTLDVRQNKPNYPTFVDLDFWSEDEFLESTGVHFVCWGQFPLSTKIDPNLTRQQMGFRKGVFQSLQAFKSPIAGVNDEAGDVTLLAIVHTNEGPVGSDGMARSYTFNSYNNGVYTPTWFLPK